MIFDYVIYPRLRLLRLSSATNDSTETTLSELLEEFKKNEETTNTQHTSLEGTHNTVPSLTKPPSTCTPITMGSRVLKTQSGKMRNCLVWSCVHLSVFSMHFYL